MDKLNIKDFLPEDINTIFRQMELAEQVISEQIGEHPAQYTKIIHDSFKYLGGASGLFKGKDELYKHHCREIIQRLVNGSDLSWGTDAEIVGLLCEASQQAPLDSDHSYVYLMLFKKVMGVDLTNGEGPTFYESYTGRAEEIISRLRKKLKRERDCHKQS